MKRMHFAKTNVNAKALMLIITDFNASCSFQVLFVLCAYITFLIYLSLNLITYLQK